MSTLSTHVLDTSIGRPAAGLALRLERQAPGGDFAELSRAETNDDGRAPTLVPSGAALAAGIYRLTFDTQGYFQAQGVRGFYPYVQVVFELAGEGHYHVPLLLSPFGYSTYRGS
jgi:5-hydroxyisourate hydrolase